MKSEERRTEEERDYGGYGPRRSHLTDTVTSVAAAAVLRKPNEPVIRLGSVE